MDTCSVRGDTVSQTNVLSFARICVVFCPNKCHVSARIGGSTAPPDPPSRTPMIRNGNTQRKLLSEDRSFEQAMQIALADEAADAEAKQLHSHGNYCYIVIFCYINAAIDRNIPGTLYLLCTTPGGANHDINNEPQKPRAHCSVSRNISIHHTHPPPRRWCRLQPCLLKRLQLADYIDLVSII